MYLETKSIEKLKQLAIDLQQQVPDISNQILNIVSEAIIIEYEEIESRIDELLINLYKNYFMMKIYRGIKTDQHPLDEQQIRSLKEDQKRILKEINETNTSLKGYVLSDEEIELLVLASIDEGFNKVYEEMYTILNIKDYNTTYRDYYEYISFDQLKKEIE